MTLVKIRLVAPLLVLVACGGTQKPAGSEADTSSLENGSSATASAAPAPSATAEGSSEKGPGPLAAVASAPASSGDAPATDAPAHPVPGATGSIDGKPFTPRLAQVAGPMQKDGRLPIVIHEGTDCIGPGDAKPGDASIRLLVPWTDGYKVDLAALKRGKKGNPAEAAFLRVGPDKKSQVSSNFKPTGLLTIVSAPMQKDAIGKLKVDLQSGGYMVAGDLDVKVCVAPK